jgi:predicted dehydrogenase
LKKLGVGVIGCGFVGSGAHVPAFRSNPTSELVALADADEKRLKKAAQKNNVAHAYTSHKELIADEQVETVVVSLPTMLHAPVSIDAMNAGKHVICEMPLSNSLPEIDKMIEASRKNGVHLLPGLNFRFTPVYVKAKELIESGELGKPIAVNYREYISAEALHQQWSPGSWAWDVSKSGGPLFTLSVWSMDLLRWMLGGEIMEMNSVVNYTPMERYGGIRIYNGAASIRMNNGCVCSMYYSGGVTPNLTMSTLEVLGDNTHSITVMNSNTISLNATSPDRKEWMFREKPERMWGHAAQDEHFVDAILNGKNPAVSALDGRIAVEAALKLAQLL